SARTRTVRGTGLGLAISRSIVKAHGGQIWAEPTEGGARFVSVLPVEPSAEFLDPPEGSEPDVRRTGPSRGRVVVVDDDPFAGYSLKHLLLARGYTVGVARDADQAMAIARKQKPDIIVADVRLAGAVDGVELTAILRHDPDTRSASVLVVSGAD